MRKCLNIGSGMAFVPTIKTEKWINIDKRLTPDFPNDIPKGVIFEKRDLEKGLPIDSETVDEIRAWHILEHLHDMEFLVLECWRVLKPGGFIDLRFPHFTHKSAYGDPTHVRIMSEETFTNCYKNLFEAKDVQIWNDGQCCMKLFKR